MVIADLPIITYLNHKYRGKPSPTDVLSFEYDTAGEDFPDASEEWRIVETGGGAGGNGSFEEPAGLPFVLGEIYIAAEVAERQAAERGYGRGTWGCGDLGVT